MKISSNLRKMSVKPEEVLKAAFSVDLLDSDLKRVVSLGLEEFMHLAGMLLVQQVLEAEVEQRAEALEELQTRGENTCLQFLEAEQRFRTVEGYRELRDLKKKIETYDATKSNTAAA